MISESVKVRELIHLQYFLAGSVQYPLPVLSLSLPWVHPLLPVQIDLTSRLPVNYLFRLAATTLFSFSYLDIFWDRQTSNSTSCRLLTNLLLMTETRDLLLLTTPVSRDSREGVSSLMMWYSDWPPVITGTSQPCHVSQRDCVRYNTFIHYMYITLYYIALYCITFYIT